MKPRPTDLALVAIALLGCTRTGRVVDAAMIPSEVAAQQAKPEGGRLPSSSKVSGDLPWRSGQRLRGTYNCTQGKTQVVVEITDVSGDHFDAIADFTYAGGRSAPARGKWRMRGSFDVAKRSVRFEADGWIDEPDGYLLVDFVGKAAPDGSVTGTVDGKGCTTFSLAVDKTGQRSVR